MNEKFEIIIKELIFKLKKEIVPTFLLIFIMISIGCILYFFVDQKNISYLLILFGLFLFILIPLKYKSIDHHQFILNHYQNQTQECLKLLNFYKNNLNGTSVLGYIIFRNINRSRINLYKKAIYLLKNN